MSPIRPLAAAALILFAGGAAPGRAAPAPDAAPLPAAPTSNYSDGTGDSAVDSLNASQLDNNYRGPRYLVRPGTAFPVEGAPPPPAVAPFAVSPYPSTRPVAPPPPVPTPPAAASAVDPSAVYPDGAPGG